MSPAVDITAYLERIGFEGEVRHDRESLEALQRAHLTAVPFENLDVYAGRGVSTDLGAAVAKIVERGRGGWCFEANGAFSALLEALGFEVSRLGAAVLLDGPNETVDHLAIEVVLDQPYLVDVGFGDSFIVPLALNRAGPQDGGTGTFELLSSPQGTTVTEHVDGVPAARYRFSRLRRSMADFEPASRRLQSDPDRHWRQKPFATRLLDGGPDRVTLLSDRLTIRRRGQIEEIPVPPDSWDDTLGEWFDMAPPW